MRRLFAVMGMEPVGYYDLSTAGVPVHATAFRPIREESLERNPFRVFTSLLRLELIDDLDLRRRAADILARRQIFTERCLALIDRAESAGGLSPVEADELVDEALHTFRWHGEATVDIETYQELRAAHPLIADVVCFKGPHVNHLTPRVLDIDSAQRAMHYRGIRAKDSIEGPPRRRCPILLRQTSFLALNEPIRFVGPGATDGRHTARFGEIEQRGCALTRKGRKLYDVLLSHARSQQSTGKAGHVVGESPFDDFPDDWATLRREGLAYFRYSASTAATDLGQAPLAASVESLIEGGWLDARPLTYEDFLPVSAAGIFRSNLGAMEETSYEAGGSQRVFEAALGRAVNDEIELYESAQAVSLAQALSDLGLRYR
ncbi:Uncharacterized metalloenzyme YdcJ, glyoxalase superfamily [Variovorax sp. CF079]|nr:Uncharacterized metalloenzyme YdcJ, glyoxalase superfamily [Variovorax sp. CF079]